MSAVWNLWQKLTVHFGPSLCWRSQTPDGCLCIWGAGEQAQAFLPASRTDRAQNRGKLSSPQEDKAFGRGRMVEAVRKAGAGQQASWAAASRALGQLARMSTCRLGISPDDCLSSC